jgi:hypothetical protein
LERPDYLYKYHSASRVAQILRDLTFYFTPVSQLDDLYEFRIQSLYTVTPETKYRVYAKQLVAERIFSSVEEAMAGIKSLDFEDQATEAYSFFKQQLDTQLGGIMQHTGVTCFSAQSNNQRMWAQYGDGHKGAVIEFTTSITSSRFAAHLMPVLYTKTRMQLCPSEFLTSSLTLDQWLCGALCCIKHWHWRDQDEWRLMLLTDLPQTPEERIVPFERTAISRVFLGPRISPENESDIRCAASRHSPEIPVFKRKIDDVEAREEHVGFEQIHSLEQLLYWAERCSRPPDRNP